VYTPANEALRQAIELKKRGDVRYVVAGPVNALFADESDGILFAPEIDLLIVPSAWVLDFYRGFPQLIAKSRVCPCGVDAEVWKPSGRKKEQKALIYWKSGDERFCEAVEAVVRQSGLEPVRFQSRAGEHAIFKPEDYREGLVVSIVGIFLSTFETQGIALAEAWSMDVPTVVWDPQGEAEWRGRTFKAGSSAPFLTPATGAAFQTIGDLATVLRDTLRRLTEFQPRQWVLEHMTDAVCAEELYNLIRREAGAAEKPADIKDPAARSSAR
jgi:glycosyltransferase involved in cell wall biosynthesis